MNRFFALFLVLGTITGCQKDHDTTPQENAPLDLRAKVRTQRIVHADFAQSFSLPTTIYAHQSAVLVPKSAGRIEAVAVNIGDSVHEGDTLLTVEQSDYLAGYKEAKAAWELAKIQMEHAQHNATRFEELYAQNAITLAQLEEVQMGAELTAGQAKRAEAGFDIAKSRLNETKLLAPFAGTIIAKNVEMGEMIGGPAQRPPLMIADLSSVKFTASISEHDALLLAQNQEATLVVAEQKIPVTISRINQAVDPVVKTVLIEGEVENTANQLKHQQSATLEISLQSNHLAIPREALLNRNNQEATVFVVDDSNIAHQRQVTYGRSQVGLVPVISGVQDGEKVLIAGHNRLKDGDSVVVLSEDGQ